MSISQYAIGGLVLTTALAVGWAKWNDQGAKVDKAEARTAIAKAECSTNAAVDTTEALNQQITDLTREVERQKIIAAAAEKKSRDRLAAYNALNRKIGNVPTSQNVPVSDHLESVLDAQRVRGSVSGPTGTDRPDQDRNDGKTDPAGRDVSPAPEPTS